MAIFCRPRRRRGLTDTWTFLAQLSVRTFHNEMRFEYPSVPFRKTSNNEAVGRLSKTILSRPPQIMRGRRVADFNCHMLDIWLVNYP